MEGAFGLRALPRRVSSDSRYLGKCGKEVICLAYIYSLLA